MRPHRAVCLAVFLAALLSGCGPVRENRQINFSADGKNVGFQHGNEGVFVAGNKGEGLRKIFTPAKDTLAVSTPLFAPTDKRLIFTTARPVGDGPPASGEADPAGAIHTQRPVVYTCWLRGDKDGDAPAALFEAKCDHVGYVAANLAVRWHPKGDRLLFLEGGADGRLGLFEFDLATKATKPIFPHRASAMIHDWAPDNEHLVCVLGGPPQSDDKTGIWIGKPGANDWWHVPGSKALAAGELSSTIEQLRATTPAWTTGGRFAFASSEAAKEDGKAGKHLLSTADLAKRTVTQVAESGHPFRDLRWAKDGRLGVVEDNSLRVVEGGKLGPAVKSPAVRQFAGWSADGAHLAYVALDPVTPEPGKWKALLFVPDPLARDVIYLAPGSADSPGREALSGVRVTFPHWSPTDNKLSFWGTFTPSHRSWLGAIVGSSLLPGDPAAVIDPSTGKLEWMPVSPGEMAQVGHYHLLKRDNAEAWRWYEKARRGEARPAEEDFAFFESYCLTRLGRHAEAKAKLEEFRKSFVVAFNAGRIFPALRMGRFTEEWVKEVGSPASLSGQLLRDLYQGEVFLALDAAEDGEAHFRKELESAKSDEERSSRAVLLAQMLLAQNKRRDYARLAATTLLPLAAKRYDPAKVEGLFRNFDVFQLLESDRMQQAVLVAAAGLTLLPLSDRDVLDGFSDEDLKKCLPLLEAIADKSTDPVTRKGSHMILFAAARKLNQDRERRKALDVLKSIDDKWTEETFDERARADLQGHLGLAFLLINPPGLR